MHMGRMQLEIKDVSTYGRIKWQSLGSNNIAVPGCQPQFLSGK